MNAPLLVLLVACSASPDAESADRKAPDTPNELSLGVRACDEPTFPTGELVPDGVSDICVLDEPVEYPDLDTYLQATSLEGVPWNEDWADYWFYEVRPCTDPDGAQVLRVYHTQRFMDGTWVETAVFDEATGAPRWWDLRFASSGTDVFCCGPTSTKAIRRGAEAVPLSCGDGLPREDFFPTPATGDTGWSAP